MSKIETNPVGQGFVYLFVCVDDIMSSSLLIGVGAMVFVEPVLEVFRADFPFGEEVEEVADFLVHDADLLLNIAGFILTEVGEIHLDRVFRHL